LFSVVDALLDRPMSAALELLPFSEEIRDALLGRPGDLRSILDCTLAYEAGNWENVRCGDLSTDIIRECYLESIAFVAELTRES
jgi:EAL and modified HD-GYP domain-containing signal transduction protein